MMERREREKRPRRATGEALSKDRIAAAALELIDQVGLDRFSVRDLAKAMGVYPTAIYHHVTDRAVLLGEVAAHALHTTYSAMALPADDSDGGWRPWLREYLARFRAAIHRHPNVAPLFGAQILSGGPIQSDLIEALLVNLEAAGFRGEALVNAYNIVIAAQVGFVTVELAAVPGDEGSAWMDEHRRHIRTIDAIAYPTLARNLPLLANRSFILRWSNGTTTPLDDSFAMFVEAVIRGLESLARDQGSQ